MKKTSSKVGMRAFVHKLIFGVLAYLAPERADVRQRYVIFEFSVASLVLHAKKFSDNDLYTGNSYRIDGLQNLFTGLVDACSCMVYI